jgi:hypothetical protein
LQELEADILHAAAAIHFTGEDSPSDITFVRNTAIVDPTGNESCFGK